MVINDAFYKCHPAVNLIYFCVAMCFGVLILHPFYLVAQLCVSILYFLILYGKNGCKRILMFGILYIFLTLMNPLLNTKGKHVLFYMAGRPYTLEALYYGAAIAAVFVAMMLWLGCFNKVMTKDKLICLFAGRMASFSMVIVMVIRMIPNMKNMIKQIAAARKCIKRDAGKISLGVTTLEVLASWSLESGIITGNSMQARGYGKPGRTGFMIYRMKASDIYMIIYMLIMMGIVAGFACNGSTAVNFVPQFNMSTVSGINMTGIISYLMFLILPVYLNVRESVLWSISRRKI